MIIFILRHSVRIRIVDCSPRRVKMNINDLCNKFDEIAGGKHHLENGTCSVTIHRNINVSILGKPSKSAHTIGASISFQSLDEKGYSLNLGEIALIDEEVYPFTKSLQD